MSRIGLKPIAIPDKVKVSVKDSAVTVQGPLGSLDITVHKEITVKVEDGKVVVSRAGNEKLQRSLHGLTRSLINNMVIGVTKGYEKFLEIHGVGYNAKLQGNTLIVDVGFANPVNNELPKGLKVEVTSPTNPAKFVIRGCDKREVGEFAACIRRLRPPEPYQGKGVRYADEHIRRKAGKTFAASG
jgi:large subunit ribosomal protein L6